MSDITVESLQLEIQASSSQAAVSIDNLTSTLGRLKNATRGLGLSGVAKQFTSLNTAMQSVDGSSADKIDKLANSLNKLKSLGSIKISSSIGNQLKSIGNAASALNSADLSGIGKLATALAPLNNISKASGLQSAITQLNKLPQLAQTLNSINWSTLTSQLHQLSTALAPLANQLNTVSTAFSRLPANIRSVVSATNSMTQANNRASTSYMNMWAKARMAYVGVKTFSHVLSSWLTQSNKYVEDLNLFTASLGKYAGEAQKYAERVSELLGIDPASWLRNQGVFNTIISGFGVASDQAYKMSKNLTQLGYDISSFFNITIEDAMQKLQSGISGELEPLRRLGYDLSVARLQQEALNLGIEKSVNKMTQAEKSQLRYYAIMTQVTVAQGDMARTLNAPANQLRVLQAQVVQCARALGNIFIPVLNAVLPYAIAVAKVIRMLANTIASFFGFKLPEVDYSGISAGSSAVGDLANNADNAAGGLGKADKAAKKLKNNLLGIDELNILSDNPASSAAGGAGGAGGGLGGSDLGIDLPEYDFLGNLVQSKVDAIVEKIKENLWDILSVIGAIGTGVAAWKILKFLDDLGLLKLGLKGVWGLAIAIGGAFLYISEFINAWTNGVDLENFLGVVTGAAAVVGGLYLAFGTVASAIGAVVTGLGMFVLGIKDAIENGLNFLNGVLIPLGSTLSGAGIGALIGSLGGPIGAGIGALIGLVVGLLVDLGIAIYQNWDSISQWAKETGQKIKVWFSERVADVKAFPGKVVEALKNFPQKLQQVFDSVSRWLDGLPAKIKAWFSGIASKISQWFDDLWRPIKEYDWKNLGHDMGVKFGEAIKSAVKFVTETIPQKIGELTAKIGSALKTFFTESLPYFFTEWLPSVVQTVADFFLSLPEKLGAVITSIWEGLVEVGASIVDGLVEGLGTIFTAIGEWISGFVDGVKEALGIHSPSTVFAEIGEFCIDGLFNGLLSAIKGIGKWVKKNIIDPISKAIKNNPITDLVVKIKNTASEWWDNVTSWWKDATKDGLSLETGVELVKKGWNTVKGWIGNIPTVEQAIALGKHLWSTVKGWIGEIPTIEQGISLAKKKWDSVKSWIGNIPIVQQGVELVKDKWDSVKNWIGKIPSVSQLVHLLKDKWESVRGWIGNIPSLSQYIHLLKDKWTSVKNWIGNIPSLTQLIHLLKDKWTSVKNWIGNIPSLSQYIELAKSGWSKVSSWVQQFLGGSVEEKITLAKSGWDSVSSWVRARVGGAVEVTIKLVQGWAGSLKKWLGLADGGIIGGNGGLKAFAHGGYINGSRSKFWDSIPMYANGTANAGLHGTMFVAGENGAEMVGHINGQTEVLNRSQIAMAMKSATIAGMSQFVGYWRSMVGQMTVCTNAIIRAVLVSSDMTQVAFATATSYDPTSCLSQSVYEDSQRGYNNNFSDDSMSRTLREFYHEYVEPSINRMVTGIERQADKEEQTIVQVGNRTITDAVETQRKANGYKFEK